MYEKVKTEARMTERTEERSVTRDETLNAAPGVLQQYSHA